MSDDPQAHVGAANTGLGPMFWVCTVVGTHTTKMCIRAISSDRSKKTICIMMMCEKGFFANDNDWPSAGF